MDSTTSADHAAKQWILLFKTCFGHRIRAIQLVKPFGELWSTNPIPGTQLATIIFTSGAPSAGIDPLIPEYLEQILRVTSVDICDILVALLACSRYALKKNADQGKPMSYAFFENVLSLLVRLVACSERPKTARESRRSLKALGECLTACRAHETVLQMQNEGLQAPDPQVVTSFETLATLAIALLSHPLVKADLASLWPQGVFPYPCSVVKTARLILCTDLKDKLASACGDFADLITQWSPSQVAARLQMMARTPPLAAGKPDFSTAEIASAVTDLPVSNSRIGLYTYLNAALCARPLTDDMSLFNYLHAKYQNDAQSLVVDLIVASFDVLANALQQSQSQNHILCYRSFIANKLPTLIAVLSGSLYAPMTAQVCIQMALDRVDVHPFPPLSSQNDAAHNETLKKSRQDFVQACIMFQLGNEQAFQNVLSELPSSATSRGPRYNKDALIQQCIANVHRVEELARDLEGMSGNAGAISGALVETIQHFYTTKETMSLRTLCNTLSRRLPLMDIIFQYSQPFDLLTPLCNLLNEWTHDEDQSEFQPPYEEFASVLLLVLAVIYRYQLTETEIGSFPSDSFIARLLNNLATSLPPSSLDEDQNKQLAKWVQGLYATDEQGETNGISDETMSHCPPQSFYLLVPTLFEQSVQACKLQVLAVNTLKGGLEFLLEPFLLPSLIGGLSWVTKHSWEEHGDGEILLQMLHKLLRPDSISGDAQAMHQTIIAMVARPLTRSLQNLFRKQPKRKDIGPLLEVLNPHLDSQRSSRCSLSELNEWATTSDGGLRAAVRNIIGGLVRWSSQASINPMPYTYTHRTIVAAMDLLGADQVLAVILEELRSQTQSGSGSTALEIATAIVCAPAPVSAPSQTHSLMQFDHIPTQATDPRRTLRQALRARLEEPKELLSMETDYVEALVRLGRRVEAQLAVPAQLSMPMTNLGLHDMNMTGTNMDMTGADMQMTDAEMQMAGADMQMTGTGADDPSNLNNAAVDQDFALAHQLQMNATANVNHPGAMSLDLSGDLFGSAGQQAQAGTDDDVFAGLDFGGDEFDFS